MRPILPLLLLTACAAPTVREKVVVVEFEPMHLQAVYRAAECERWLPMIERWSTCSLPGPDRTIDHTALRRWSDEKTTDNEASVVPTPDDARQSASIPKPERGRDWTIDLVGVNITRLDDRPALRVETRFGDYGGMDRVVAWLEACGGKRVP